MTVPGDIVIDPTLVDVYKDLHSHPELGFQENRTASIVAERLRATGFEVTTGVGGTGVVGILKNGTGPTALLRADMDALPVREDTGLDYASTVTATDEHGKTVPVAHACGHDLHTTCLLGAAQVLAEDRSAWAGTSMLVFQRPRNSAQVRRRWWTTACSSGSRHRTSCSVSTWHLFRQEDRRTCRTVLCGIGLAAYPPRGQRRARFDAGSVDRSHRVGRGHGDAPANRRLAGDPQYRHSGSHGRFDPRR